MNSHKEVNTQSSYSNKSSQIITNCPSLEKLNCTLRSTGGQRRGGPHYDDVEEL
jgi:hypothetical protein